MKKINSDFEDFLNSESTSANRTLLIKAQEQIQKEMPNLLQVLVSIGGVHILASILSLAVCPQFGVRLFFEGTASIDQLFMPLGHEACFFLCGFFYLGTSFLLAKLLLSTDTWIILKRSRFAFISAMGLLSMGSLSMIGHALSFELSMIWFFGAYLGAWLTFKMSSIRHTFAKNRI